ncbi:hypothetical protein niasHT_016696 [Heterodera trifolii]|uniref:Uncharacterized protein n=1 Tax=Heterodera trifolii TaxID=157864 RepID=A0ABD2L9X9_9BILA
MDEEETEERGGGDLSMTDERRSKQKEKQHSKGGGGGGGTSRSQKSVGQIVVDGLAKAGQMLFLLLFEVGGGQNWPIGKGQRKRFIPAEAVVRISRGAGGGGFGRENRQIRKRSQLTRSVSRPPSVGCPLRSIVARRMAVPPPPPPQIPKNG